MLKKILRIFIMLVTLLFYTLKNTPIARAETILFEDDFSSGFEKWESVRNNFDLWSIVENQADVFIDKRSTLAELVPKDLYWNSEWKNIVYELDYKYLQGADKNISFGFKDVLNWYEIHFVGNSYILSHVKNGAVVWDNSGYASIAIGAVNHISITLNEGSIIVLINGNEVINVVDPTFDNDYGKIGIKAGAGSIYPTHAIYDNIIVKSLDNIITRLGIIPQKQTHPDWASEEYNSAKSWALSENEAGIDRWGCLITSISMIMNFHGIDQMPDGNVVNPSTVNLWLKSQPDGYVGSGLVNWLAITRLTKIINEEHLTPKLEYKRVFGNEFITSENEINAGKPVVLQIPGHFLVGDGTIKDSGGNVSDLYITDPAYSYEKFSDHQQSLISTRTLEPTFTDLSYLHFSHNPDLTAEIKNVDGSEVGNLQSFEEYLSDFITGENSPVTKINEIEKPESGTYIIEISQDSLSPANLTIFAYNKNGDLSNLSYSGLVGQNKIQLKLFYDSEGNSQIEKIINFETLLNDVDELLQLKEIKKHYVFVELQKFTEFGKISFDQNRLRYVGALQQLVEWYSPQITEIGKLYLDQRLLEIKGIIEG